LPSISAPPQTPIAVGGAVSEEPAASSGPPGTTPSSVAGTGPLALYLLAGVLAVGLLAGIAGLAAGSSASAPDRRTAPTATIGAVPLVQPAEAWDETPDGTDEAADQVVMEASNDPPQPGVNAPAPDDATEVRDTPGTLHT
jgi:hypothetical protein